MSGQVEVETQFHIPQYQTNQHEAAPQYYIIQAEGPDAQQTEVGLKCPFFVEIWLLVKRIIIILLSLLVYCE